MTRWAVRRHRRPHPVASLYCFPHAGGSPGEYLRWSDDLPELQVWGVHLPGRTTRTAEPPFTRMELLVDAVVSAVPFAEPAVLFGHSLGALIAFEVARRLRERGGPQPAHLVVSSCPAPPLPPVRRPLHTLPDDELLAEVERRSGEPLGHIRADPGLRAHALACYRADFAVLETYRFRPGDPLDCPITVLAGTDEPWTPRAGDWAAHTRGPAGLRLVPGGHFHFRHSRAETLRALRETVLTKKGELRWTG